MAERKTLFRLGVAVAVLALLVTLYAVAGYWIAPGYLRDALAAAAQSRGLMLEMNTVRTKPFALRVELGGVVLRGPEGRSFAEAESVSADVAWASLWRRGWIVEEVRVESPGVALDQVPALEATAGGGEPALLTVQSLVVENGTLRYAPRDLALEGITLRARDLSTLDAAAGTYEAAARMAGGPGRISSQGTVALAPLAAEGTLSVAALRAAALFPAAAGRLEGQAGYTYRDGAFALQDVALSGSDLAYAGIELSHATLQAEAVPLPPREPFAAAAQASLAAGGKVVAQGRVSFAPRELHLNLTAEGLPLAEAQRWLPEGIALNIESGTLSGTGLLDVAGARVSYSGSAAIRDARLSERGSGDLLLAWKEAETGALRFDSSPPAIDAGEIVLRAPEGRLVIEQGGSVNFGKLFPAGGEGGEPLRAEVERLRIEQGTLHFADRSLATPFEATITALAGEVRGISTETGDPARLRLAGRVQPYGSARIRGTIDLDAPANLADIRATFNNLRLEAFNPYVVKFAGYRIASGRLTAELRYTVRDGTLRGENRLAFEQMRLGEKLEGRGLVDLPLDLVVALLADSSGRISLEIPVSGSLSDPQFDFGAIVADALGKVVRKIVSAPFRALASLFGGGGDEDPGNVAFAPGSAELSPPAEESVAQVAQGLAQRPQLGVEVRGAYDPARDLQALRVRAAREQVARAAGVQGTPDPSDPQVVRAAESLYLAHGGERASLEALRKSDAAYGRVLLQQLAGALPLDEGAAQALARERAEAVRAAFLAHGVSPERVGIAEARESAGGPAAMLALKPASELATAATGGTSTPEPHDPVRAAQEKLNAAGYDAGPVDGILGPRTKRALIKFQAGAGLEITGELDEPTRKRLATS